MSVEIEIQLAFKERGMPKSVTPMDHPPTNEYGEAENFAGVEWKLADADFLERNSDALYGFNPEAFCYYLPAFLLSGLDRRHGCRVYVDTILGMLDRSPDSSLWDDFFIRRWCSLTKAECLAIEQWLLALTGEEECAYEDSVLSRAFDTLAILREEIVSGD